MRRQPARAHRGGPLGPHLRRAEPGRRAHAAPAGRPAPARAPPATSPPCRPATARPLRPVDSEAVQQREHVAAQVGQACTGRAVPASAPCPRWSYRTTRNRGPAPAPAAPTARWWCRATGRAAGRVRRPDRPLCSAARRWSPRHCSRWPPGPVRRRPVPGPPGRGPCRRPARPCPSTSQQPVQVRPHRLAGAPAARSRQARSHAGGRPGRDEQLAQRPPLGVPGAGGALVLLRHGGEQRGDQPGPGPPRPAALTAATGLRLCAMADEPPGAALAHLADLGLGQQHDVPGHLGRRRRPPRRARRPARPAGSGRCATAARGSARPSSAASAAADLEPGAAEPGERAGRAAELDGQPVAADRRRAGRRASSRPTSQPAALSPNVVGTACCSSVRPAIGVSRCAAARPAAASAAAPSGRPAAGRAPGGRPASPPCPGCPGWSRRGGRTARRRPGDARPAARATSGTTGLPLAAAAAPSAATSTSTARQAAAIACGRRRRHQPGRGPRPGPAPPRPRAAPRSQAASATAAADLAPGEHAVEESGGPQMAKKTVSRSPCRRMSKRYPSSAGCGDQRGRARSGSTEREHRVGRVGRRLVGEVDPGHHPVEQAAGEHRHGQVRRLGRAVRPGHRPGLDVRIA